MKKLTILISFILLLSVTLFHPASAAEMPITIYIKTAGVLYYDELQSFLADRLQKPNYQLKNEAADYREIYLHYSDPYNTNPDWVLIYCPIMPAPYTNFVGIKVGDMLLCTEGVCAYFASGYLIYDVEKELFISLTEDTVEQAIEDYPDLINAAKESPFHLLIGDTDADETLSILDAPKIQCCLVGFYEVTVPNFSSGVGYSTRDFFVQSVGGAIPSDYGKDCEKQTGIFYIADFDQDGDVTILDATAIQRTLVDL